jgi:hypothetical protein
MSFQISGLKVATFAPLFGLSDSKLALHGAVRYVADQPHHLPCRVSLRDADPGETLLLLNYEHLPVATAYRSRYAIFVREFAQEANLAVDEVPEQLRSRLLSVRGFDGAGTLLDADVVEGRNIEPLIQRLLSRPGIQFLHAHNAKPGCFAARIDPA